MGYKVLIVDDEAPVREMFNELLKKDGYQVHSVESAEDALEAINKDSFEVVLLDVKLKGMSGLEALKKIKDTKPDMVVIMITGFGYDNELITKSREYGCAGYIGKNMPIPQILGSFKLFIKNAKPKTK